MQATMQARMSLLGATLRIHVIGAVDVDTAPLLREQVQQVWRDGLTRMELDFSAVEYLSSPGIALLLEFRHGLAKDNATVVVTAASPQVREVLATCRLDGMFLADNSHGPSVPAAG